MKRTICIGIAAMASSCVFATVGPVDAPLTVSVAKVAPAAPLVPQFGIRFGGGNWNQFVFNAGIDATFSVPLLPIPTLRIDAELWGSSLNSDVKGNALSLLGVQNFLMGYAGAGPSFYFTDNGGDHKSGLGLKVLGGLNLPDSAFVEAGLILGPSTPPLFITVGKKF